MTYKLKLEPVRADGSPDTRLWMECLGCQGPVMPFTDSGRRFLMDRLCTTCFKRIAKWAVFIGDLRKMPKSLNTATRLTPQWHLIRDNWIRERQRLKAEAAAVAAKERWYAKEKALEHMERVIPVSEAPKKR